MGWWGKSPDSKESKPESQANTTGTDGKPFEANKLPASQKLPEGLQKIVDSSDKDSSFFDNIAEG